MNIKDLPVNAIIKVNGGEGGFWRYTGRYENTDMTCQACRMRRSAVYEFLHYKTLDDLKNKFQSFDFNAHYGSECVKYFIGNTDKKDIIEVMV